MCDVVGVAALLDPDLWPVAFQTDRVIASRNDAPDKRVHTEEKEAVPAEVASPGTDPGQPLCSASNHLKDFVEGFSGATSCTQTAMVD